VNRRKASPEDFFKEDIPVKGFKKMKLMVLV
jgi:hypothetical protein